MKFIISFLFMFTCLADFTGKWSGQGFYDYNQREGRCSEVFMELDKDGSKLYIVDGGYICGDIQASYPASSFDIINGEIFYYGEKVGVFSDDSIHLNYDNGEYKLKLNKVQDQILYREVWDDGEDYLSIEGKLDLLL